jgi:hypothetical protein
MGSCWTSTHNLETPSSSFVRPAASSASDGSTNRFVSTIRTVRKILSSAVTDGFFVLEKQTEFEFLYHFDTVDEWVTYLEEEYSSDLDSNQGLIRRARRVLSGREGEALMREWVRAARLRRHG